MIPDTNRSGRTRSTEGEAECPRTIAGEKPWNYTIASELDALGPARREPIGEIGGWEELQRTLLTAVLALIAAALGITLLVLLQQQSINPPWEEAIMGALFGCLATLLFQRLRKGR